MGATHFSGLSVSPTEITAATATLTEREHSGKNISLNLAATQTITLPAATGSGASFPFYSAITATGDKIIQVASASDIMQGNLLVDGTTTSTVFPTAADSDTITMNGTTKGGIVGSQFEVQDVAAGVWRVTGILNGSGAEATPFSAAV